MNRGTAFQQGYQGGPLGQGGPGKRGPQRPPGPPPIYDQNAQMGYFTPGQPAFRSAIPGGFPAQGFTSPPFHQYAVMSQGKIPMYQADVPGMMLQQPDAMYAQPQMRQMQQGEAPQGGQFYGMGVYPGMNVMNGMNMGQISRSPKPGTVGITENKKKVKNEQQQNYIIQQQQQQQQQQSHDLLPITRDSFQRNPDNPPGLFNLVARGHIPSVNFVIDDSCLKKNNQ